MIRGKVGAELLLAVEQLRAKDPGARAADMGRELHKTREAIRLALVMLELPTNFRPPEWGRRHYCKSCGAPISRECITGYCRRCYIDSKRVELICDCGCGRTFRRRRVDVHQAKTKRYGHKFYSRRCLGRWLRQRSLVKLTCDCGCGAVFYRSLSDVNERRKMGCQHSFYNQECFGRWLHRRALARRDGERAAVIANLNLAGPRMTSR